MVNLQYETTIISNKEGVWPVLILNPRDGRPVRHQVKDGLRALIVSRAVEPGEALPTAEQLAVELAVNPNTIRQALEDLEQEGYVTIQKDGRAMALPKGGSGGSHKGELLHQLDRVVEQLSWLGVTVPQLVERIERGSASHD